MGLFCESRVFVSEDDRLKHFQLDRILELNRMRRQKFLTDINIIVDNTEFPVHSEILSSVSEFFKCKIQYEASFDKRLIITVVSAKSFSCLLEFIYTGELQFTKDNFYNLFHAGNYFIFPELIELCEQWLMEKLQLGSKPNKTILSLSVELFETFDVPKISRLVYSALASHPEKYKDVISGIGVDFFHTRLKMKDIPMFYKRHLRMGKYYLEAMLNVYRRLEKRSYFAESTILKIEDCYEKKFARPSSLYISRQHYCEYPTDHSSCDTFTNEWFVTCKDFPPEQWTICGMTVYVMPRWSYQYDILAGVDIEYRNIWTGEKSSFLCGLNTEYNMQYRSFTFKLNPGETISSVIAYSGWLLNNLAFNTNTQRRIGFFLRDFCGCERDINRSSDTYVLHHMDSIPLQDDVTPKLNPCLFLHGFAYKLIRTFSEVTWINVQVIFAGLDEDTVTQFDVSNLEIRI